MRSSPRFWSARWTMSAPGADWVYFGQHHAGFGGKGNMMGWRFTSRTLGGFARRASLLSCLGLFCAGAAQAGVDLRDLSRGLAQG